MPIKIYYLRVSPPCRAVMMTAKQLNIELTIENIDASNGEHYKEDYSKINPGHKLPTIDDDGFILGESRAIMQYLCNQYAPDSALYPNEPKTRALVDRWLNSDLSLFLQCLSTLVFSKFKRVAPDETQLKSLHDSVKLLDQLIGDNKYLVGNQLTIADLSVLATTSLLTQFGDEFDLTDYSHLISWSARLQSELPYYDEVCKLSKAEIAEFVSNIQNYFVKMRITR